MKSIVYFYSKFTEEFLLLGAAGVFTLLSIYCYHWVIQKRRLGVARSQIPSTVVKSYLNQLINEAEYVRTQLFGMTDPHSFVPPAPHLSPFAGNSPQTASPAADADHEISPDLLARINALEGQLKDKESLVVNINIEKTKLLDEIERLRKNPAVAPAGNQDQLTQKIKNLESRLEEYALFEEDLANLKRLQQENTQLKKKIGELGVSPESAMAAAAAAPVKETPVERPVLAAVPELPKAEPLKPSLDQNAIESLLNGTTATPPQAAPVAEKPIMEAIPAPAPATPSADQFENLVDSVENSLDAAAPAPAVPVAAAPAAPEAPAEEESALANKTDEELLKEFENLLNS